jgi:hypothetical protein
MPVRASLQPSSIAWYWVPLLTQRALKSVAVPSGPERSKPPRYRDPVDAGHQPPHFLSLTSDQVGIPAELKHINKRRKRNQQGLPQ